MGDRSPPSGSEGVVEIKKMPVRRRRRRVGSPSPLTPLPEGEGDRKPSAPASLPRGGGKKGFSLLEMIVVIALAGLLAALAAPALVQGSAEQRERRRLGELVDLLRGQRVEAIRRAEPVRVRLAVDGSGLTAGRGDEVLRRWSEWTMRPVGEEGEPVEARVVRFDSRGRSRIRRLSFSASERSGTIWTIVFDPVSGTPTLQHGAEGAEP